MKKQIPDYMDVLHAQRLHSAFQVLTRGALEIALLETIENRARKS